MQTELKSIIASIKKLVNKHPVVHLCYIIASSTFFIIFAGFSFVALSSKQPLVGEVLDSVFHVTSYIQKQISKRVDSGYSGSFIIDSRTKTLNQILFFAHQTQGADLSITAVARNPKGTLINVFIDGEPWWKGPLENAFVRVHIDITNKLKYDVRPAGDIHSIQFIPENISSDALIVVDSVVVVHNQRCGDGPC